MNEEKIEETAKKEDNKYVNMILNIALGVGIVAVITIAVGLIFFNMK